MQVLVRPGTIADAAQLAELRWESRYDRERKAEAKGRFANRFASWFEQAVISGEWFVAVAEHRDGGLVGCMYLRRIETVPVPGTTDRAWGYVTNAFVRPTFRGQGAGGSLLALLVNTARERSLHELHVWPSLGAVSLYRRAGFLSPEEQVSSGGQEIPAFFLPLLHDTRGA